MGNGNSIGSHDSGTGNVINGAGVADIVAGVVLIMNSDLIHYVVGGFLIALGVFLLVYVRVHKVPTRQAEG